MAQKELDKVRNQLPKDQQADFDKSMQQIADHLKDQQSGEKTRPSPTTSKRTPRNWPKKATLLRRRMLKNN